MRSKRIAVHRTARRREKQIPRCSRNDGDKGRAQGGQSRFSSRRPSGRTTSIRRAEVSIATQISCASGTSSSPRGVSTSSSGVPFKSSPGNCTSRTRPTAAPPSRSKTSHPSEIAHIKTARWKHHAFAQRNLHFQTNQLFRIRHRIRTFEMKNRLAAAAVAKPAFAHLNAPRRR